MKHERHEGMVNWTGEQPRSVWPFVLVILALLVVADIGSRIASERDSPVAMVILP